jgi:protein ImuA
MFYASRSEGGMDGSVGLLNDLRSRIARFGRGQENPRKKGVLPFGVAAIDNALPERGLALGALHEVSSAGPEGEYAPAATLFVAGVLARLPGEVLWVTGRNDLYAPALAGVGLSPARLTFVEAPKTELLQVIEDAIHARCFMGVTAEITGALSMTATRRLQLAADKCGTTVLLLRRPRKQGDPALAPSAAMSRWRVVTMPSPVPLCPTHPRPRASLAHAGTSTCFAAGALTELHGMFRAVIRRAGWPWPEYRRFQGNPPTHLTMLQHQSRETLIGRYPRP